MSLTDPIADLLTRIRNAQRAGLEQIELPASKIKQRICEVLRDEGFVREVSLKDDGRQGVLTVILKYALWEDRQSGDLFPDGSRPHQNRC